MSTEDVRSRKAKKAQRDAERKKAGKKRKREDGEEQQPEAQDELKNDFIPLAGGDEATIARDSGLSFKKRKISDRTTIEHEALEGTAAAKTRRRKKFKPATTSPTDEDAPLGADAEVAQVDGTTAAKPTKSRFILFIGNLPYTATDESITAHFKSIQPFTLRHRVDPKTKKSKGFAFLEFENYDRMKTCLKLYHHSTFDPAQSAKSDDGNGGAEAGEGGAKAGGRGKKKDKSRRINVELTAGGGGKSDERKEKIKLKNAKLEEQRKRRREAEEKAAVSKEKKAGGKKATGVNAAAAGKVLKETAGVEDPEAGEGMQGVHPARLARMKA